MHSSYVLLANTDSITEAAPAFVFFGPAHIASLLIVFVLPILMSVAIRRSKKESVRKIVCWPLAVVMLINEVTYEIHYYCTHDLSSYLDTALPLHLCDIAQVLVIIFMLRPNVKILEIVYFWGLAGTTNALITPDVTAGFPSLIFTFYFVAHGGIVIAVLVGCWGFKMRPTFKSMIRAFVIANLLGLVVMVINLLLDSNYMFLCRVPDGESPFFFAPWPWYLLVLELIGAILFVLLYLPYAIGDLIQKKSTSS